MGDGEENFNGRERRKKVKAADTPEYGCLGWNYVMGREHHDILEHEMKERKAREGNEKRGEEVGIITYFSFFS